MSRRALLDVNVLIALLDSDHLQHQQAVAWLQESEAHGWASCPITQNGFIRILSNPRYRNPTSTADAIYRLRKAVAGPAHEFWQDSVSLFEAGLVNWGKALSCRTLTDAYLLALAVKNNGRLVTFDRGITTDFVNGATSQHLLVL